MQDIDTARNTSYPSGTAAAAFTTVPSSPAGKSALVTGTSSPAGKSAQMTGRSSSAGKSVLITGCSSGIGRATAASFARNGWNVIATLRDVDGTAAKDLAAIDGVMVTRLDVQDPQSITDAINAGIHRFGKIDALINNAGFGLFGLFEATSPEKIQQQFDVNVFGVMAVTRAVLPHFRKNKRGVIVNVSSGAGLFTLPMISLYCASKFALEGFSEALAYELASQNIGIKIVEPHGGVSSTRFSERSASEYMPTDDSSKDSSLRDGLVKDYGAFVARTNEIFSGLRQARMMSADDIAQVIYTATTDGTAQLRYAVGDDSRGIMKALRELPDQEYVEFMRSRFS
jgi:NAD(P)-dependent dehydrogenase (short-subunit alcohol dehydrogenase family)